MQEKENYIKMSDMQFDFIKSSITSINERFGGIENRFEDFKKQIDNRFDAFTKETRIDFKELVKNIEDKIISVNKKCETCPNNEKIKKLELAADRANIIFWGLGGIVGAIAILATVIKLFQY